MGWTWHYIDQEVDLPMVQALSRYWRQYPPPQVQLARITAWMGYKAAREPDPSPAQEIDSDAAEYLGAFPVQPMPRIMSADEYKAQKVRNEHQ